MLMPFGRLAGLTLGVALVVLCPAQARGADDQKPAPRQAEEQEKAQEQKKADGQKTAREKAPAGEKPSPAPPRSAPLRFSDEDLERFHAPPPPAPADDAEADAEDAPGVPGAVAPPPVQAGPRPPAQPGPAPPAPASPARGPRPVTRPVVRPPGIAPRPQDDPLKPFRDREAKEKFRTEQIQRMRDRLAGIDKRLEYLNARKAGVLDPLAGMPAPRDGDDAKGETAMRPRELLEKIDLEIKGLEQEKEQVQADLVSIETRFSHEMQSR